MGTHDPSPLTGLDEAILEGLGARMEELRALEPGERADALAKEQRHLRRRATELGLNSYFVDRIFEQIRTYAEHEGDRLLLHKQNPQLRDAGEIRVAFQGSEGAFSHLAIRKFFADRLDRLVPVGHSTIRAAFDAVRNEEVDYAMLPIENTIAGSINQTYEMLNHTSLVIVGEEIWPVQHCLLALEEVPVSRIRRIYSHPVALEQCTQFLSSLRHCTVESFVDTAEAAKRVRADEDFSHAAIASEEAAELYGLVVVKRDIANNRENFTRFVLVARKGLEIDEAIPCKTSLLLVTGHEEGALVECLKRLSDHGINMTKLESRPIVGAPFEYMFYIDIEGNAASPEVQAALGSVRQKAVRLRILGSYPAVRRDGAPRPPLPGEAPADASGASRAQGQTCGVSPPSPVPAESLPFRLASRSAHPENSVFRVKGVTVGKGFTLIAGPCAVESRAQILDCARIARDGGATILRGGVFKPRTSPYSFQGLGPEGLDYLAEAGEQYNLPTVTEVVSPDQVALVASRADILQIGARNMQNFPLLREVGMAGKPVFLKRGMMASIEEWLLAAEYILAQGNQQVMLCERGIRSFDTATRNTLDISAVPVGRSLTHLPIFIDPSHACGVREWIPDLAAAAAAVRADGIMVEIHPDPDSALCDKAQALGPADFQRLVELLARVNRLRGE
jgi:chorismate mutase / prephenate dehydratase